ncbi:4-coumarate- ligase [Stagonosporopsis vannaccii]|nr:4-coumarate- ligase [Stagonosporopsis vannaccii]
MLFTSQQPDIELPKHQTLWSWLFESRTPTFNPATVQGFTDVSTLKHITFTDLAKYTETMSTIFYRAFGLRERDVVVVYSKNSIWYPLIALAAVRIGAIACAVSPEYTTEELAYALRLTKAKLFFTGAGSIFNARLALSASGLDARSLLCMDANPDGLTSVQDLLAKASDPENSTQIPQFQIPAGETNHDVCAYLCLSSGTTGLPKAVMVSHGNIIAQCLQVQQITPKDHDKIVAALPFYHITGIVHELHLPIAINAHTYVLPTYTLDSLLETVCRYQIKELLIVPPILIRLVRDPATVDNYDLSHIRRFSSGAAPLPREILDLLEKKFPNTGFKQGYGMTESCSAITSHPPSKYAYKYADKVGMLVGSTSVKIIDPTTLKECGVGSAGEIWARGPQVAMGYLNNPSASAETFDKDGFLHTGDIGYIDEEGLLSITDRMKEMIKVKGIGVAPAELENLLLGHPAVNDVAVTGIPDDRAGERPKAFVVLKSGDRRDPVKAGRAILEYVKEKRARHKWMTEVEIVDSIPKSPAGKILRRKLREKAAGAKGNVVIRDGAPKAKL